MKKEREELYKPKLLIDVNLEHWKQKEREKEREMERQKAREREKRRELEREQYRQRQREEREKWVPRTINPDIFDFLLGAIPKS